MRIRQAVVMVGGKGTRLRPLTENRPKPSLPVVEHPCLWYLLRSFADAGVEEVILACGYKSQGMRDAMGDGSDLGIRIVYVDEDEPLGTGGALKNAEHLLDPVFLAANGDVFMYTDFSRQIDRHFEDGAKVTIAVAEVDDPSQYGVVETDSDGRITGFKEKPRLGETDSKLINAGVYVVDREVLSMIPRGEFCDFSGDVFPEIVRNGGGLSTCPVQGLFMDVGHPLELLAANLDIVDREHPEGHHVFISPDASVTDTALERSVILEDCEISDSDLEHVLVMKGCRIMGAVVRDSILGEGCEVMEGAVVENSILGDGEKVSPGEVRNDGARL